MPELVNPFRVAIVGAGKIAAAHVKAIDAIPGVELVAVVDPDSDAASGLANGRNVVIASDLATVLAAVPVDAAIVATPSATHTRIGTEALDLGLHVLIEKPVAPSRAELRGLVERAAAAERVLVSGQVLRFLPTSTAARDLIQFGAIGEVEQVVERRVEYRSAAAPWWSDVDDFLLHHWGSHSIDLILDLFDVQVTQVFCRGGSAIAGFDGIDSVNLLAELSNGGRISLNQSFSSRQPRHELLVIGSRGTLEFSGYRSLSLDGTTVFSADEDVVLDQGFRAQLANFVEAARDGAEARAAAETVESTLAVLEAASRSLASGQVEPVSEA